MTERKLSAADAALGNWRTQEYRRLASRFDPLADIPLRVWQQEWAPGRKASADAFSRVLGVELPVQLKE